MYLKLEIRVACSEFLAFKYVFIVIFEEKKNAKIYLHFFETKQMIIYICTLEILKTLV